MICAIVYGQSSVDAIVFHLELAVVQPGWWCSSDGELGGAQVLGEGDLVAVGFGWLAHGLRG